MFAAVIKAAILNPKTTFLDLCRKRRTKNRDPISTHVRHRWKTDCWIPDERLVCALYGMIGTSRLQLLEVFLEQSARVIWAQCLVHLSDCDVHAWGGRWCSVVASVGRSSAADAAEKCRNQLSWDHQSNAISPRGSARYCECSGGRFSHFCQPLFARCYCCRQVGAPPF